MLDVPQLRAGLFHMHSVGVVHRDLTSYNLLLDAGFSPKVSQVPCCYGPASFKARVEEGAVAVCCVLHLRYLHGNLVVRWGARVPVCMPC